MFESYYNYTWLKNRDGDFDYLKKESLFKFKTKNGTVYHALVEEYDNEIFVLKFYPKVFENHPKKYNLIINKEVVPPILRTCFQIIKERYLLKVPTASFGFIGTPSAPEFKKEKNGKHNTQRYRIYAEMVSRIFGPKTFTHMESIETSSYLLVNNKRDVPKTIDKAMEMFRDIYPSLGI